jgi:small subunit ribosomal protein S16
MKKMGRKHQPFYRICAIDGRAPRDGKVIEELGHYDPLVKETDARAILNGERINYWLSVGAQPSEKVRVLIKKYGANGTHLEQQKSALERVKLNKPMPPPPRVVPRPKPEEPAAPEAAPVVEPAAAETTAESGPAAAEG